MSAESIPDSVEFVSEADFAAHVAELLRDNMPGGIYIEAGDDPRELFVISRGARSAGIFSVKVSSAELQVCDGD